MLRSLFTGVTGLKAHQVRLDVVSNNIANVNTTAFKSSRVRFDDVLSQTIEIATSPEAGRGGQNPKQIGLGVLGTTISRDMAQGAIEITNKTTDLAIQGNGFFIVRDGETIAEWYTRDGNFAIDRDGSLVLASNGFRVQGWNAYLDAKTNEMTINSSNPVEDIKLDFARQMAPVATTSATFGGNLDSRMGTALDPVRVGWMKNGVSREVELRFIKVHPTEELYLWRVYDPTRMVNGDFALLPTDTEGNSMSGIVEIDPATGRVIANYIDVTANDAADPANGQNGQIPYLSESEYLLLKPADGSASAFLWARVYANNPARSFNGYDYFTLDTNGDGDAIQTESDSRIAAVATAVSTLAGFYDVTVTAPNAPFSVRADNATFPDGFSNDAIFQAGIGLTPQGRPSPEPGNALGLPVQFIQSVTNETVTRISADRRKLQLANVNIIDSERPNPSPIGLMGTKNSGSTILNGTDPDSVRLYIDGVQHTRIDTTASFTPGAAQFKIDAANGIIELFSALPAGVNAIVSYDYEVRPTNTRGIPSNRAVTSEIGAGANAGAEGRNFLGAQGIGVSTVDRSGFYVPGSGSFTIAARDGGGTVLRTETFTEVPYDAALVAGWGTSAHRNRFMINPSTGDVYFGGFSNGLRVNAVGNDLFTTGSYSTYRRFGGEQSITAGTGAGFDFAGAAAGVPPTTTIVPFADLSGTAMAGPYVPNSAGTLTVRRNADGLNYTFSEVAFGSTLGVRQFTVDPANGNIHFGEYFGGASVTAADYLAATVTAPSFEFFANEIGVTGGNGPMGAGNAFGNNDLWRIRDIPQGGTDAGQARLWLQGDGIVAGEAVQPSATSLVYLPTISTATNLRAEMNYQSDDRVNIIIPNGLTKTPNVNVDTDKSAESFQFTPNTSQITGNAGNNNASDSGDTVSVNFKNPETYRFSTAFQGFDSLGTPHNVTVRFEKLATNQWLLTAIDPTDPAGERVAGQRIVAFDANGRYDQTSTIPYQSLNDPATASNGGFLGIYFDPPEAGGAAPPWEGANPVRINLDLTQLFQTARSIDAVVTSQNGAPAGKLESFSFNDQGFIVGLFDNGRSMNLARVALQGFVNPAGLVAVGGNMFKDTVNAGRFGSPQRPGFDGVGTIVPGALEGSNVDLSVEFVDLIITQRGFQAQSRTITTADQVLQEVLALKR